MTAETLGRIESEVESYGELHDGRRSIGKDSARTGCPISRVGQDTGPHQHARAGLVPGPAASSSVVGTLSRRSSSVVEIVK